ncbi:MAG: DUF1016 N-terminal domain-containing protein, partial [Bacteroidales bacterium]|nr:DUF1016 N-terminal domain-containing protein [Bacteroidales bacterium]
MKQNNEYKQWLVDLKSRIRQTQIKAAVRVNEELLRFYWDLGQDIVARQLESAWGSGFFEKLSTDLRAEFPYMQGFSERNLKYCKQFYLFYTQSGAILHQVGAEIRQQIVGEIPNTDNKQNTIRQQVVAELGNHPIFQIPWGHHVEIIS